MSFEDKVTMIKNLYDRIVRHPGYVTAIENIDSCRCNAKDSDKFSGMALLGPGGVGKSTVLKAYEAANPRQKVEGGIIIPVVRARISSSNSPIAMLRDIIKAISPMYLAGIGKGISDHEERLSTVMKSARTEVLLIDEAQNFLGYSNTNAVTSASSALKNLMEDLGITIVVAGTEQAIKLIQADTQMPTRIPLVVRLSPFKIETSDAFNEFRGILTALEKSIGLPQASRLHEVELAQRIYFACDGNFRILTSLLHNAINIAMREQGGRITREVLQKAFVALFGPETKDANNPFSNSFIPRRMIGQGELFSYQAGV